VTGAAHTVSTRSDLALDGLASGLFAVFVVFLFLGYLDLYPKVPYSGFAAFPLFGALVTLLLANWRSNHRVGTSLALPSQ